MRSLAHRGHLLSGLLFATVASSLSSASDLKLDGQATLNKPIGTTLSVELKGGVSLPALLAVDSSPGPVSLFGESLDLGFTPSMFILPGGLTDGAGTFALSVPIPSDVSFIGATLYMLGVLIDPSDPNGLDFSSGASVTFTAAPVAVKAQLAGNPLAQRPHFEYVKAFNMGSPVSVAIDTLQYPTVAGKSADIYVVNAMDAAAWDLNPVLVDVTNDGANSVTFNGPDLSANTFVVDNGSLPGFNGEIIGVGYDVVIDLDGDGKFSSGDVIDGYSKEAGLYVVHDITTPGPYAVTEAIHNFGTWLGQDVYWPTNIASLGKLPLVVISHGNGHNYQWYDHIGKHLASYGFIVMSHQNNTVPGIETSSTTTLTNTDEFIKDHGQIAGGALIGHVASSRIAWIGHSRGGEGVARAYDRIVDGTYTPSYFGASDIKLISSIAPTDFLGTNSANPHGMNYHLWVGQADADVTGCANNDIAQSYHLLDRAENQSQSISLHGVGHGDFHDGGGSSVATGPNLVGRATTHTIIRGYVLPLVAYHLRKSAPSRDFLTRQWESFHPIGAPFANPSVNVDLQFTEGAESGKYVIDDFQTNTTTNLASSGAAVTFNVSDLSEGILNDSNSAFTLSATDKFNGFTQARPSDTTRGIVFEVIGTPSVNLTYDIQPANGDWSSFANLSFRACQATRDALTTAFLGDATFEVELLDGSGNSSLISIGAFGGGLEEPYQRSSCGTGQGWGNEFETIRLPLSGFTVDDANFDLADIDKLIFRFGSTHGSVQGRFGMDDLELTTD